MKHAPKDYEGECEQQSRGSKKEWTWIHHGGIGLDCEQTLIKHQIDVNRILFSKLKWTCLAHCTLHMSHCSVSGSDH